MSENPTVVVPCPRCGQMGSGNFCNHCGADLRSYPERDKDPFAAFASGFLNLKNFQRYLQLYFRLLSAPVANTIKAYDVISFENAVKFLQMSVAFYTLVTASNILFITLGEHLIKQRLWKEIFAEAFYLIVVVGGYLILLNFFYLFASRRWGKKDKHDYVKMYCLFAGFVLPLTAIVYYLSGGPFVSMSTGKISFFVVLRVLLNIGLSTATLLYAYYVWQYFWKAPGLKVVSMLLWAALISFIICFAAIIVVFSSLDIDL
jgi:hypothetical protein